MTIKEVKNAIQHIPENMECVVFANGINYPLLAIAIDCDDDKVVNFGGGYASVETVKEFED